MKSVKVNKFKSNLIPILADMVESRDALTGGHLARTTEYVKILLGEMGKYKAYFNEIHKQNNYSSIINSAKLHDIGKIAVSDSILNKPDKLTGDEYEIMKGHVLEGEVIINKVISRVEDKEFLHNALLFISYHHEKWDGTGYPYKLSGESIPLFGRIMALSDVYDALVSERPYKKAISNEAAEEIIISEAGKHFDPKVVEAFKGVREKFREIANRQGRAIMNS